MDEISNLLSEDSVIQFVDGKQIKGSKEVAAVILRCCREYNHGYVNALMSNITKGFVIGAVLAGTGIIIYEVMKSKKDKKEA